MYLFKNLAAKIWVITLITFVPFAYGFTPQKAKTNQKQIEREREKKKKQEQKKYDAGIKRHQRMQSKETRERMKQTKKESKKATPIRP